MNSYAYWLSVSLTALFLLGISPSAEAQPGSELSAKLEDAGETYTFAIVADPQLGHRENQGHVPASARRTLLMTVDELNAMDPQPAFVVFLGDVVNVFDEKSVAHFEECIAGLKAPSVMVHGNHDTLPPFEDFKAFMVRTMGFEAMHYCFDAGPWHYVVIPSNLPGTFEEAREAEAAMLKWLEADLEANRDRPTMLFVHFPGMPQGLTQLEWYNYPLELRQKLMALFTEHGNVRYYFNGHVHNGIETSVKTAWSYQDIRFLTVPTIIQSRNFGEEYAPFARGQEDGGYYLLAHVDGEDLRLEARLAGEEKSFVYPDEAFKPFTDDIEPRWFRRVSELASKSRLMNGGFEDGLEGWRRTYRYEADGNPGFVMEPLETEGDDAAHVLVRTKEPVSWANDENAEIYQLVEAPANGEAVLRARYMPRERLESAGGYIRLAGFADGELACFLMFKWGKDERESHIMARAFGYAAEGQQQNWLYLQQLGQQKQGLFWDVPSKPGAFHDLQANVPELYDAAVDRNGAFADLGVDTYLVAAGTWVSKDQGAVSSAWFDDFELTGDAPDAPSHAGGQPLKTDASVFQCEFGQELADRIARNRER